MDTDTFTQIISSPELKVLFDSVETALRVPEDPDSFAKSLMLASHVDETVSQIKLLSQKLDLKKIDNVSGKEDSGTICVFDVDVFFEKDDLQVLKRDPDQWIKTTHLKNERILKVIFVHSKSLRVIETKYRVYREYKGLFHSKMLHIQHEYEDYYDIAKLSANAKAVSIERTIQTLIQSIPSEELVSIINKAAKKAYSRTNIRNICFNELIADVGTVNSDSYACRFFVTVRRIKAQLVKNTLHSVGKSFASEICKGILHHIESKIESALKHDLLRLRFDISDDIFAKVTTVMFFIALAINPLLGAAAAVLSLALTFVWSVDVNSERWRGQVAEEIFLTVSKNKDNLINKILPLVEKTCIKTTEDLKNVSKELEEWTQKTKCMDINEMVSLWEQREAIKNISGLSSCPSVLNLIAGIKDNEPTLKVFLRRKHKRTRDKDKDESKDKDKAKEKDEDKDKDEAEDKDVDKKTREFFQNKPGIPEKVVFVKVPSTSNKEPRAKEEKRYSLYRIDKSSRETIGKIIKRQGERLYANHSSIVGLGIGSMDSKLPCIIIYCLDKDLVPFGEKPLPQKIEGYPCNIREDIVMFGCCCFDCHDIAYPNSGCCIGVPSKRFGSAGFLVKNSGSDMEVSGFLTAAHVAADNWSDLYFKKCLLSELDAGVQGNEIVHPLSPNSTNRQRIGKVKESFCGNWGPKEIGIDAAFVQNNNPTKAEFRELRLAEENELNYNEEMIVLKRGGATGETFGRLLDGSWSPCINPPVDDIAHRRGCFYFFESCFAIEDINNQFFNVGDSGSGVLLTENRKPTKPLGIAFAKLENEPITFVCRINQVAEAFNLRVYEILERMDVDEK